MRRLQPAVMRQFYVRCIGSMEEELKDYPRYDQRKHALRYRIVGDLTVRHASPGATVVDVGCASALVLDQVRAARGGRGIGFDLSPFGVHQRGARPDPPTLAQAVVEHIPLRSGIADVVVFSEVIEHLLDAYAGLREVSRISRDGAMLVLTTNNGSEMPCVSPLSDPLTWVERMVGWWLPGILAFRNITWHDPINREADPLPDDAPTYVPHVHFSAAELTELAADAGFERVWAGSFEFPAPQSRLADLLRQVGERHPRAADLAADAIEHVSASIPGVNRMGTHHALVFRKVREPLPDARRPWWVAALVQVNA